MTKDTTCTLLLVTVLGLLIGVLLRGSQARGAAHSPPPGCELSLCACTSGPPMCARNTTGTYMQLPDCFVHCFRSCCWQHEMPYDLRAGRCMVPIFAEVVVEPFSGTVGLVEACPGIWLAAVDGHCP